MSDRSNASNSSASRRDFMQKSAAAVIGAGLTTASGNCFGVHQSRSETLRLGLVGCGGRGTGAAADALEADPNTKIVAMADVFKPRLEGALARLQVKYTGRVDVGPENQFIGFEAYRNVIESDVDVVLLATPPHFRPLHLKACIDANKHVFAEKPVAVDAPGVRSVIQTVQEAKRKNLAIVSGLCWRYETGMIDMVQRIHDGAVGDIVTLESMRYGPGVGKLAPRKPEWSDMEYQLQNWYYFTWLSGDFIVEQFVHELDKLSWIMGDQYPVLCNATGGRQTRVGEQYGHIYDHFACTYEYASGVKYFATTRHQKGCDNPFYDIVFGSQGSANLMKFAIKAGDNDEVKVARKRTDMHLLEHVAMYQALRRGDIINNGDYMAKSTLMAIMGRMAAYTGKSITWEQAFNSQEDLSPPSYDWDVPLPDPPVAMPGQTKFI